MECPDCGFMMDAFTIECPRCKIQAGKESSQSLPRKESTSPQAPQAIFCPACGLKNTLSHGLDTDTACLNCGCFLHTNITPVYCPKCQKWNQIPKGQRYISLFCSHCKASLVTGMLPDDIRNRQLKHAVLTSVPKEQSITHSQPFDIPEQKIPSTPHVVTSSAPTVATPSLLTRMGYGMVVCWIALMIGAGIWRMFNPSDRTQDSKNSLPTPVASTNIPSVQPAPAPPSGILPPIDILAKVQRNDYGGLLITNLNHLNWEEAMVTIGDSTNNKLYTAKFKKPFYPYQTALCQLKYFTDVDNNAFNPDNQKIGHIEIRMLLHNEDGSWSDGTWKSDYPSPQ